MQCGEECKEYKNENKLIQYTNKGVRFQGSPLKLPQGATKPQPLVELWSKFDLVYTLRAATLFTARKRVHWEPIRERDFPLKNPVFGKLKLGLCIGCPVGVKHVLGCVLLSWGFRDATLNDSWHLGHPTIRATSQLVS